MGLMRLGPMLRDSHGLSTRSCSKVRGDTLAFMKNLDGGWSRAHFDHFARERIRRTVETAVENDVVIDVHFGARPLAQVKPFGRQRPQSGTIKRREQTRPRSFTFAKGALVQLDEQLADRQVEFPNIEKLPVS